MHLFYAPDIQGNTYQLSEEESKHASRVLRLGPGDEVILTDGKGNWMKSEIADAHPKKCLIQVLETIENYHSPSYHLEMAVAPTKNINRFEWYLEKATEIGINKIYPLLSEHSERKVIKKDRLEKVVTSAMKQSLKAWHPELNELIGFKELVKKEFNGKKFIAWCEAEQDNRIENHLNEGEKAMIFIGPEGGFSPDEINLAKENDFIPISISKSRLRTETAAVVACHSVAYINKS
jgi:16S rRNA (uracil1498-N3)-methyltransferase